MRNFAFKVLIEGRCGGATPELTASSGLALTSGS